MKTLVLRKCRCRAHVLGLLGGMWLTPGLLLSPDHCCCRTADNTSLTALFCCPAPCPLLFSPLSTIFTWYPNLLNSWPYLSTSPALLTSRGSAVHCTDRGSCAFSPLSFVCSLLLYTRWLLFTTSPQRRVDIVDNIYFSLNTTDICVQIWSAVSQWRLWPAAGVYCVHYTLHTLVAVCSCPSPHHTPHPHRLVTAVLLSYIIWAHTL